MARTGDRVYAAEKAGYAGPKQSAHMLMQRQDIVDAVDARRRSKDMLAELLPAAAKELGERMLAPGAKRATNREFAQLAGLLFKYSGIADDEAGKAKGLDEMTAEELQRAADAARARLAALEQARADRAKPVLDLEPDDENAQSAPNIFD